MLELGLVVGAGSGVVPFALQVVEVDATEDLGVGGDGDNASVFAAFQSVQEKGGEQEWREVVDGESALEPVVGDVSAVPVAAGVVHEHVDAGQGVERAPRPGAAPGSVRTGLR
jgi:hypothetical protein